MPARSQPTTLPADDAGLAHVPPGTATTVESYLNLAADHFTFASSNGAGANSGALPLDQVPEQARQSVPDVAPPTSLPGVAVEHFPADTLSAHLTSSHADWLFP